MRSSRNAALQYLVSLYDSEIGLLPEYAGAKDYWLFHDNYLAARVLRLYRHPLSARIVQTMRKYGIDHSGKIEILFDEGRNPLPFRIPELPVVKEIGEKNIRTERLTDRIAKGWENYADLLFLAAIGQRKSNRTEAAQSFERGMAMWDGKGFNDAVTRQQNQYNTYKLALGVIASIALGKPMSMAKPIWKRLASLQHSSGGFITDYAPDGRPLGLSNVETTSLVILALSQFP